MEKHEENFCQKLAAEFADVRRILDEHLADNDELLPHVFMGDITRYVLDNGPQRAAIVQRLEDTFARPDQGLDELIGVSFVENIETSDDLNLALREVHGDSIRHEWQSQHQGS